MAQFFIAIASCVRDDLNGSNEDLRKTWLLDAPRLGLDYKFFIGTQVVNREDVDKVISPDVVKLEVGDNYLSIAYKYAGMFSYVLDSGYAYAFAANTDTCMCLDRLISCGFERYDYYGDFYHKHPEQPYPHDSYGVFCQGGQGFFISRKFMQRYVDKYLSVMTPSSGFEPSLGVLAKDKDILIGDAGWKNFTTPLHPTDQGPRKNNSIITCHLSCMNPSNRRGSKDFWHTDKMQRKFYQEWVDSLK